MTAQATIGLDVGGTKILGAVVSSSGTILQRQVVPTPSDPEEVVRRLVEVGTALQADAPPGAPVGVGYPALITRDGLARYGPNISTRELQIGVVLSTALGVDVTVDNDATCATWAEFRVGAGAGVTDDLIMFTLGTGIGGGLVIGGRVVRGANGFAGELGHIVVAAGGRPGKSGIHGEIEAYSSGSAFVALIDEAVTAGAFEGTSFEDLTREGLAPTPAQVEEAAADGMQAATQIITLMGWHLGLAMASMVNILDPSLIVVGGGAAKGGDLILDPARASMRAHILGADHRPTVPVVPAALGPDAGVIGAALLAADEAARG